MTCYMKFFNYMIYTNDEKINFELDKNKLTAKVIHSPKAREKVLIPFSIIHENFEYIIDSIDDESFQNNYFIKSIDFPKNSKLLSIGKKSFSLSSIKKITIPSSVEKLNKGWCCQTQYLHQVLISPENKHYKYLDENHQIIIGKSEPQSDIFDVIIFASRNIEKVFIPSSIKYIDSYAFSYCSKLKTIEFSKSSQVKSLGEYCFSYCFLTNILIPDSIEELKKGWCRGNFKLQKIFISPKNKNFKFFDEKKDIVLRKSDSQSDNFDVIQFANRYIKKVMIPATIKYIEPFAFSECRSLHSIEFQSNSNLLSIGEGSFCYSGIRHISIPSSTEVIEKYAFFECTHLQSIQISNNSKLRRIMKKAFNESLIQNIFIPSSLNELDEGWNYGLYNLENISFSPENKNFELEGEMIIEKSDTIIFANHNVKDPKIPSSIRHISSNAFSYCRNIQTIEFSKDSQLISIGKWAFFSSSIEMITIPASVTEIKKYTFYRCHNLKTVDFSIDSKLTTIERSAFYDSSIENLTFPSLLKNLDERWSYEVRYLKSILISGRNEQFKYIDDKRQMVACKSDAKSDIFDVLVFASRSIEEVFIPSTIRYINSHAFSNCKMIKSLEFSPKSRSISIGEWGLHSTSIERISIPSRFLDFDNAAFGDCMKLQSVEFLECESLTINNYLFSSCISLTIISLPNCKSITIFEKSFEVVSKNCLLLVNANAIIHLNLR